MSNLRSKLATRVEPRTIHVDVWDGPKGETVVVRGVGDEPKGNVVDSYTLFGMPDDYSLTLVQETEQVQSKTAALWNAHLKERWIDKPSECPSRFTKEDIYKVKLVHHYLLPDPILDQDGKQKADDAGTVLREDKDSEVDVAMFSKEHGPAFIFLYGQSVLLANNKSMAKIGEQEMEDPAVTVGKAGSDATHEG